ncbi:MAG TPA: ABC transporter ATP-binding protein [Candidatus Binataceae bacterium]|nr:ABC transporter ATP-binding protein [Candidatus Binataceae bacterium]
MMRATGAFLRTLLAGSRAWIAFAIAMIVLASMTEGVGVMLLLPTLQIAGLNLTNQGAAGRYTVAIRRGFESIGLHPTLLMLLGIFVVLVAGRAFLSQLQILAATTVEQQLEDRLRRRLYGVIVNANWLFVCRSRSSDFTHALTAEIERVGLMTFNLVFLSADVILSLVYLLIAFLLSAPMTAVVLVSGAVLALLMRGRTHALHESGAEVSRRVQDLFSATIEHVQNLKTVKTYGAQARSVERFAMLSQGAAAAGIDAVRQQSLAGAWFELGSTLAIGAVVYVSIRVIAVPPAELLILLLLFVRVMPRFMSIYSELRQFIGSLPAFSNVIAMEARCAAAGEPPSASTTRLQLRGAIELRGVSFSYRAGAAAAVAGVDLRIPAGGVTALVGPSGAGKSTIADLVMGLMVPDTGSIAIDDLVLSPERARGWRDQIGYVGSDSFLFHETVRNNLLWARPGASEEDLMAALRLAAAEFVVTLAAGLDTVIGDRGAMLSQGERQRIALARALLRKPSLLILDEATNALDSESEARVLRAIDRLRGELTILLIAHRLSTIRWADLIHVIENGRVVESGSLESLSARHDGRLRALCEAQSITL